MINIKNIIISFAVAVGIGSCGFTLNAEECSNINNKDYFSIEISEMDEDGQIKEITYKLEDLSCSIYDSDRNLVYSGPVTERGSLTRGYSIASKTIKSEGTMYWYPTNNSNGFKCGNGIAVTVTVNTNLSSSKTIGLTNGDSSSSTSKNPSAILYTGTSGYWKFYLTNHSSSSLKVTGGSLSWGE